ncbi:MAG TPA: hypothetical protein VGF04_08340 [Solirubrobacterales bacterium]
MLARLPLRSDRGLRPGSLRASDLRAFSGLLEWAGDAAVIVVGGGVGRSAVALGLAAAAAVEPRTVALLECDLVRPVLGAAFDLAPNPGLAGYLRAEAEPEAILQPLVPTGPATPQGGEPVICIVAGAAVADPRPLLDSERFRQVLSRLRSAYQLVVIDSPPFGDSPAPFFPQADVAIGCASGAEEVGRRWRGFDGLVVTDAAASVSAPRTEGEGA